MARFLGLAPCADMAKTSYTGSGELSPRSHCGDKKSRPILVSTPARLSVTLFARARQGTHHMQAKARLCEICQNRTCFHGEVLLLFIYFDHSVANIFITVRKNLDIISGKLRACMSRRCIEYFSTEHNENCSPMLLCTRHYRRKSQSESL